MLNIRLKGAQLLLGSLIFGLLLAGCTDSPTQVTINGKTMGTTYTVKVIQRGGVDVDAEKMKYLVDSALVEINNQMSTYIPSSEISRFNGLTNTSLFPVSKEFASVIKQAMKISRLTEGAFDITVAPLIELWGFKYWSQVDEAFPPSEDQIWEILENTGFAKVAIHGNQLKKLYPGVSIDLNAIAKGFGVDVVSDLLDARGIADYMVEIGGEVRCAGTNNRGKAWQIGVDTPKLNVQPGSEISSVISLENQGMATSGDYRNYFQYEGKLYSHVVDPRTGYPVETQVASATVVAPTCMEADALATSLMVMGAERGLELVESLPGVEAMIIIRKGENQFQTINSPGLLIAGEKQGRF